MELYQHQLNIIKENKTHCLFALGTGSGKTLTALSLAEGETLVIAPKTTRDDRTWQTNLEKLGKTLPITVISKEDFRLDKFNKDKYYTTIIIDEAHTISGATPSIRYRNRQPIPKCSQVFDKLLDYLSKHPPKRLYLLTATPTRSAMSVWAMAQLLGRKWSFYEFRDVFYFPIKNGRQEFWVQKNTPEVKERLGRAVRSLGYTGRLEDYFDVPDQSYKVDYLSLTKEQTQRLKEIETEYPDPLVKVGKKHQIENGVLTGDEFSKPETFKDEKIEKILDYASEFPKLIIFAKYTAQVEKIKNALKDYNVLTLQGHTKDRGQVIKDAEGSKECILIIQSQISAGFELPSFPVMIFASMSYSVVDRIQAEGRILRANALKKNLYITLVIKGGVDEAVYKSILNKQDFNEKIYVDNSIA